MLSKVKPLSGLVFVWGVEVRATSHCGLVVNAGQHPGAVERLHGAGGFVADAVAGEPVYQWAAMDCVVQHGALRWCELAWFDAGH